MLQVRILQGTPKGNFDMAIDLHGYTVHQAWSVFRSQVDDAYFSGHRTCRVITGYGAIQGEISTWAHIHDKVVSCQQQVPNLGSFIIKLKKRN